MFDDGDMILNRLGFVIVTSYQVMCASSQLNDHLKAFIKVMFTALLILYHILPGNIVDAFPISGCESGLFLHVNPETRTRVCCITVPLPKGFEYVGCEVNGGYDRIAKCPDGLYQVDNTTTASEAKCSSEIECNPDENLKISDCDAQGHCIFSCICNYDKGYCGLNFYDCQSFPSDCDRKWVQKDCTCKWKPTASTGSALGNATNKPVQKIITTPSTISVDGASKPTEKKGRTVIGEEDDKVLLTIKNNETGFILDQKQRGLQHYEIIIMVLCAVVISACIIGLAVYCWKSKRNREYQSVGYSDGPSNSSSDTDDKPDIAVITLATEKEIDQSNDNSGDHGGGGRSHDTDNSSNHGGCGRSHDTDNSSNHDGGGRSHDTENSSNHDCGGKSHDTDNSSNHDGGGRSHDTDNRQPDNAVIPQPPNKVIDQSNDNSSDHDGGGSRSDTDNRQPDNAMIPPPPNKVIGSRERPVAHVKPQPIDTAQAYLISGLSTFSDQVRYTSEPSAVDEGYMNQISFSEQGTLTMEGYSDFTWDLDDNPSVPTNEETAVLKLDNQQEQDDMRSEQQPSEETHTKELHQITTNNMEDGNVASEQQSSEETHTEDLQVATNNMEYDVPEDESLYSQFSSGMYHVTNT